MKGRQKEGREGSEKETETEKGRKEETTTERP